MLLFIAEIYCQSSLRINIFISRLIVFNVLLKLDIFSLYINQFFKGVYMIWSDFKTWFNKILIYDY